jgi:predicted transcriptional regulator
MSKTSSIDEAKYYAEQSCQNSWSRNVLITSSNVASYTEQKICSTAETTVETILNLIKRNPGLTQNELVGKLGLTRRGVELHIKSLKDKGLIARIGPS